MKFTRTVKIALIAVVLLIGACFLPQYRAAMPGLQMRGAENPAATPSGQSAQSAAQTALAEIAAVQADSQTQQLALITEPDDGVGVVRAAIASAAKSLDLVIYELEDPVIEQDLADAETRGIAVRVILQNVKSFSKHPNQAAFDFLKAHSVPVIWAANYFALTHQKTLIVDANWALVMTFNLAPQYYASSRDFGLVDSDPQDVAAIEAAFVSDWNGAQGGAGAASPAPAANARDLVWSPGSAGMMLALINGASSSLDVYNEEMADPRVTAALEQAAARGVRVRVVMTYATNWKPAFNELTTAGVVVRTFASTAKLYIHAKIILADGVGASARAFIGSENFSGYSLDKNRELGILIAKQNILASLEKTFNKDWTAARPYTIKK